MGRSLQRSPRVSPGIGRIPQRHEQLVHREALPEATQTHCAPYDAAKGRQSARICPLPQTAFARTPEQGCCCCTYPKTPCARQRVKTPSLSHARDPQEPLGGPGASPVLRAHAAAAVSPSPLPPQHRCPCPRGLSPTAGSMAGLCKTWKTPPVTRSTGVAAAQLLTQSAPSASHPFPGVYLTSKFNKLLNK